MREDAINHPRPAEMEKAVNSKSVLIMIGLLVLTLGGFVFISNLIGARKAVNNPSPLSTTQSQSKSKSQLPISSSLPSANGKAGGAEKRIQTNLAQAQELLVNLATAISINDWATAQQLLSGFESKTRQLPAPQLQNPDISPLLRDFFELYKVQLERAIVEQNAQQAEITINQLYGILGEQLARLSTSATSLELQRLRFLVRELELWGRVGDEKMLQVRAGALREAWWQDARPLMLARHRGVRPVKNFDQLIQQLTAASSPPEFVALVPEFSKELDQIDNLFPHPSPRSADNVSGSGKPANEEGQRKTLAGGR